MYQTIRSVRRDQENLLRGKVCFALRLNDPLSRVRPPEYTRLLDSLPRAKHARYNTARPNARNTCFEGTREAILENIYNWVDSTDRGTPPIFWLNGLAGIGKTTIAHTAAERADERGLLGASFFFSRGDGELTNPRLVIPTLAFQLAQFDQTFKTLIGAVLEKKSDLGYLPPSKQLEELIIAPLLPLVTTE